MPVIRSKIEDKVEGCFTSMIDVVFLLLIFFILQPFKEPDFQMPAYLPKDTGMGRTSPEIKPTIQLRIIGADDRVSFLVDDEQISDGNALAYRLLQKSGGDKTVPVAIGPAPQVNFSYVMKALDQCAVAEMQNVTFSAQFDH